MIPERAVRRRKNVVSVCDDLVLQPMHGLSPRPGHHYAGAFCRWGTQSHHKYTSLRRQTGVVPLLSQICGAIHVFLLLSGLLTAAAFSQPGSKEVGQG